MLKVFKKLAHDAFLENWKQNVETHRMHWLEVEVTHRCQLHCLHCGSSCGTEQYAPKELDFEEWLDVFRKVAKAYDPAQIKVAVTGGEPLVRPDIYRLIANITEMGYKVSLMTNGMTMDDRIVKYLAAAHVNGIGVSIDGLEENHDWLRNKKGAFAKATDTLKRLRDSGFFYVEPITTVNKRNLRELERMEEMFIAMDMPSWRMFKTFPIGRANGYPELFLDGVEFKYLMDFIRKRYTDKRRKMKVSFCEIGYLGEYELDVRSFFAQCFAGINTLAVLAEGSITGCAAVSPEFIQGNVRTDDVVDVWEHRFHVFRDRSWMKQGKCGSCNVYPYCRGDGFHLWKKDGADPAECNYSLLTGKSLTQI
ncbi:MAG: hypothetical protein A2Y33_03660 [Spirochaetes bacterium GWF1_51_8]|nr:MAG: hypothetical protein A2Y33_03660 [Spirochaetes bacterium GWF1_51_8]